MDLSNPNNDKKQIFSASQEKSGFPQTEENREFLAEG